MRASKQKKLVPLPTDDERSAFQFFQCAEGKKIIYWHLALVSFKLLAIYILELLPYRCQTGGEGAGRRDGSIFKYFFIISRAPPRGRRALVLYVISYFFFLRILFLALCLLHLVPFLLFFSRYKKGRLSFVLLCIELSCPFLNG